MREPATELVVISHRCRGYGEKENSLAALKKALADDIDGVEMDLQPCNDGIVVWHNPWITIEGKRRWIRRMPLQKLRDVGLATLEELLNTFKKEGGKKTLYLDLKRPGIEEAVVTAVLQRRLVRKVIIVSWITKSLERIHQLAPQLRLSYSFSPKVQTYEPTQLPLLPALRLPRIIRKRLVPLHSVNLAPLALPVTKQLVRRLRNRGIKVVVCNVDTEKGNKRLARIGVWGTMTNSAHLFRKAPSFRKFPSAHATRTGANHPGKK